MAKLAVKAVLIRRLVLACALQTGFAGLAWSTPIDLTYTVMGTGGLSAPQLGVSDSPFWWVDTSGTMPAAAVPSFGFDPFAAFGMVVDGWGQGGGGSLLLSSSFTLGAGVPLEVSLALLRAGADVVYGNGDLTAPLGFALLLREDLPPVVLANISAMNRTYYNAYPSIISLSDAAFVPTSPGVTTTMSSGYGLDITLNGAEYAAQPDVVGYCGCFLDVTSTYTPGEGAYQLLFGLYDFTGSSPSHTYLNGALAVADVQAVPEPTTMALMSTAMGSWLAVCLVARRRRWFKLKG